MEAYMDFNTGSKCCKSLRHKTSFKSDRKAPSILPEEKGDISSW